MFYFLSLLTGILISVMVAVNGGLTEAYDVYPATVIIHIAGLLLISAVVIAKKDRVVNRNIPVFLYLGGAIGVLTTVFNNMAFGQISVSAILALGLLGQSIAGLIIDQFGLFGMPKHSFTKGKLVGFVIIIGGIAYMIGQAEVLAVAAVIVSFVAGVNIVLSRSLNAKLAERTSVYTSTFYNYVVGLTGSVIALGIFIAIRGGNGAFYGVTITGHPWWIYFGGVLGVCVVFISNITAPKISAFFLSLLIFVGKIFAGIVIDYVLTGELSAHVVGGMLVAVGLVVNLLVDRE